MGGGRWRGRKETFLSSPPLPALLLAPFFARSWTLVACSLLLNRTEKLATRAKPGTERSVKGLLTLQILFADQRLVCQCGYVEIHAGKINAACFKAGQGCKSFPYRLHNISKEQKRIDINYGDIYRGYYMAARRYEISLRVLKNISRVSAAYE